MTIVPLRLYLKGSRIKLEIALAKGKKLHDKREAVKERESKREIAATGENRPREVWWFARGSCACSCRCSGDGTGDDGR
jgi:hypothetical protein